jgi:hypothetical protein
MKYGHIGFIEFVMIFSGILKSDVTWLGGVPAGVAVTFVDPDHLPVWPGSQGRRPTVDWPASEGKTFSPFMARGESA